MSPIKKRIEEIKNNGYQLDFGNVFEHAFENYKKIVLYAGLMLLVYIILLIALMITGIINYIGIDNMEAFNENLKNFKSIKDIPLNILLPLEAGIILLSGFLSPFYAGFLKMADCGEKDEEFHISSMFAYYKSPYFANILISTLLLSFTSSGLAFLLELAGIQTIGTLISLTISFLTFLTIPFVVFGKLNAFDAIKSSIIIVSKQPLVLLGLLIVAIIGAAIGIFGLCIGIFFTIPFLYSMEYTIYSEIIGVDSESELVESDSIL